MVETRKHSSRMRTNRAVARPSSEPISMRPIVDRQTPVKTLPSLAIGKDALKVSSYHLLAGYEQCLVLEFQL